MTTENKLIYRGSVKDIYYKNTNEIMFSFSDRYSVFDWGEMPDHIEEKGACLNHMAAFFFQYLEKPEAWSSWTPSISLNTREENLLKDLSLEGLGSHFIESTPGGLVVKKFHVPDVLRGEGQNITYDYDVYQKPVVDTLIPLEVIFRFGVPEGSSIVKRREDLKVGDRFEKPLIEFSTKLEKTDRYLKQQEAQEMAGMSDEERDHFFDTVSLLSLRLKDFFAELSIELWDGKFEFAFDSQRNFVLVDSIGPDELRLMVDGVPLSKEFLRQYYVQSPWKKAIDDEKLKSKNWKSVLVDRDVKPDVLAPPYREAFSSMYKALTNRIYNEEIFACRLTLQDVVGEMKLLLQESK